MIDRVIESQSPGPDDSYSAVIAELVIERGSGIDIGCLHRGNRSSLRSCRMFHVPEAARLRNRVRL